MSANHLRSGILRSWFWTHPFADRTLCHFLRRRLSLPTFSLAALFPDFDEHVISISQMPRGDWSTPLADLVMLLKLAACTRPGRLMEIGSFRGYTSLLLAQHTVDEARIVTVDRYAEHGEAYRGTPWAAKIDRRVGETSPALFAGDAPGSYDLIFIDADHSYEGVRHDSELALPLVAPTGYVVWHDYANWGYFDGKNGVPEYLAELAANLPIARVTGSDLAIHSPDWTSGDGRERFLAATRMDATAVNGDQWEVNSPRG